MDLPNRSLRLGPTLLLGSIALAGFLLFFAEFAGGISGILIVLIPLLLIGCVLGLIITIIGAVGWSIRAPLNRLLWLGSAFTALGLVCSVLTDKMNFGFDDPSILFATVLTDTALLVGFSFYWPQEFAAITFGNVSPDMSGYRHLGVS